MGEHVTVGADGASKATQPYNPTQGYVFFCHWQAWQASSYARSARLRSQRQQSIPGLCAGSARRAIIAQLRRRLQRLRKPQTMINRPRDGLFEACNCLQRNKESITRHNFKVCFHFRCYGWEPHLDSVANPGVGAGPGGLLIERLRPPNFFQARSYLAQLNVRQPVEKLKRFFVRRRRHGSTHGIRV